MYPRHPTHSSVLQTVFNSQGTKCFIPRGKYRKQFCTLYSAPNSSHALFKAKGPKQQEGTLTPRSVGGRVGGCVELRQGSGWWLFMAVLERWISLWDTFSIMPFCAEHFVCKDFIVTLIWGISVIKSSTKLALVVTIWITRPPSFLELSRQSSNSSWNRGSLRLVFIRFLYVFVYLFLILFLDILLCSIRLILKHTHYCILCALLSIIMIIFFCEWP